MAGGARKDDDDIISDINVTPFVDIVLVLLIIFMVTATYIVSRAIPVDLPKASSGEDITTTLALTLTKNGDLYLDGRKVGENDVKRAISSARRNNREARAVIAADREVAHGRVVRIIDLVRRQGVSRFAINIESE
ncbi:MAG: biopolymer transporter ExbD [Deltaproteobacteria bacterium]|nr:biopolymer transporter ExbD [Deltaproteobacteria bacterium]